MWPPETSNVKKGNSGAFPGSAVSIGVRACPCYRSGAPVSRLAIARKTERAHHVMDTDNGFPEDSSHGLRCVGANAEAARHPRSPGESNAINILDNVEICFLQRSGDCEGLDGMRA